MKTFTLTHPFSRLARRFVGVTAVIGLCAVTMLGAAASDARAAETPPDLSVSLSNAVDEVAPEKSLDYVAVVQNLGSAAAELRVVVTVPEFMEIATAADATVEGHTATWTVTVEPGAPASVTASVHVGTIPAQALWADATANVVVGDSPEPVVAVTDIDPVAGTDVARADAQKAGEKALAERLAADAAAAAAADGAPAGWLVPVLIGGVLAVVALIVAALVLKSRSRRRAVSVDGAAPTSLRRAARTDADRSA